MQFYPSGGVQIGFVFAAGYPLFYLNRKRKIDLLKNFFLACVLLPFLWSCEASPKSDSKAAPPDTVQQKPLFPPLSEKEKTHYHNLVKNALDHSLYRSNFNGGVLVAKNGTIVYENYKGFADLRSKDSLHGDIPLQIASTSKTLTSAAVLKLVQEGRIGLNDPVTKYFPQFPYTEVTVKMLLNHRSGLPEYLNYIDQNPTWPRTQTASNQDVLQTLISWNPPRSYKPDTHFHYCNTNYVLLALIVEKASGQSYPDYMKQHFFIPLGMTNTFVKTAQDSIITQSYQPNGAIWTLDFSDGPYGDKNIYSTPRDLLKWDQALYGTQILSQAMMDSAFTPYSHERPGVHNYGLGWRMLLYPNGKKIIYHHGRWHGFNSAFARLPEEKVTIIILSNRFNRNVYTTAKKLYNLFGNYDGNGDGDE